jgi:hypothetical protein
MDRAARSLAELPVSQWSGWVVYLLEALDSEALGRLPSQEANRTDWLDKVRAAIKCRLAGRW